MQTGRLVLLGCIAALGSMAIQAIVPALPALSAALGTDATGGQLVISVYLAVLAIGQLLWAPASDSRGRRPVLLAAIGLFVAGSALCAVATGLGVMIAGRIGQGLGASGALVAARTMAADSAPAGRAAGSLAVISSITLVSPALSPLVGGFVVALAGWRMLFWGLLVAGAVAGAFAWTMLPETRKGAVSGTRLYAPVVADRIFLRLALGNALITAGFYVFLAVSPFLLLGEGRGSPAFAGVVYGIVAGGLILGTLAVPILERRFPARLGRAGGVVLAAGAAGMVATALLGAPLMPLVASMTVLAAGSGLTAPVLMAGALMRHPERTGTAASLFGALQMGVAAVLSTLVVRMLSSPTAELLAIAALAALSLLIRANISAGARTR